MQYLMENEDETLRLEMKTDLAIVERQARWAGLKAGMRVADLACGPGKTTALFHSIVQPDGESIGIDGSEERIEYASKNHGGSGASFVCRNLTAPISDIGRFDFVMPSGTQHVPLYGQIPCRNHVIRRLHKPFRSSSIPANAPDRLVQRTSSP